MATKTNNRLASLAEFPGYRETRERLEDFQAELDRIDRERQELAVERRSILERWKESVAIALAAGHIAPPRPALDEVDFPKHEVFLRSAAQARRTLATLQEKFSREARITTRPHRAALFRKQLDAVEALAAAIREQRQYLADLQALGVDLLDAGIEGLEFLRVEELECHAARARERFEAIEGVKV